MKIHKVLSSLGFSTFVLGYNRPEGASPHYSMTWGGGRGLCACYKNPSCEEGHLWCPRWYASQCWDIALLQWLRKKKSACVSSAPS